MYELVDNKLLTGVYCIPFAVQIIYAEFLLDVFSSTVSGKLWLYTREYIVRYFSIIHDVGWGAGGCEPSSRLTITNLQTPV